MNIIKKYTNSLEVAATAPGVFSYGPCPEKPGRFWYCVKEQAKPEKKVYKKNKKEKREAE